MRFYLVLACILLLISADAAIGRQKGPLFTPIFPLQANRVSVSLDGRALGPGVTISITPQGGGISPYTGLSTDQVHELLLAPGPYTLTAGARSLDFTVTAACTVTVP